MAPKQATVKPPAKGHPKQNKDKVTKKPAKQPAKKPTPAEKATKAAQKKADAIAKAKQKAIDKEHALHAVLDDAHAQLQNVQTFYPDVPAPTTYNFRQYNPLNKSDARCLIYAFARGYYGPPNTAKCHERGDDILRRMADLWEHVSAGGPATQARVDRRRIYERMMLACAPGELQDQMDTGDWGTMEMVQILADAFDVEILVWSPNNLTRAKPFDPPRPSSWTLQARGDRHPPGRQINIINYSYRGHWCLLVPAPQSATPTVINNQDPHIINPLMSPEELRTPTPTDAPPHTVPVSLLRYPNGNKVYNAKKVVGGDRFHIADLDSVVSGTQPFPIMGKSEDDKGEKSGKEPTHKELVAAAEAELAAATKARIAAVWREDTAVANLAKLKGSAVIDLSDDDSSIEVISAAEASAEKAKKEKKGKADEGKKLEKEAQDVPAGLKKADVKKKSLPKKGATTSSSGPKSASPKLKSPVKNSKKTSSQGSTISQHN